MYYCPDAYVVNPVFSGKRRPESAEGTSWGGPCYFQTKTEFAAKCSLGKKKVCVSLHLHADH